MQRMGELEFTPRGSNPMMSKRLRSAFEKKPASSLARTNSTPDAPGPPGLMTSDPIRAERSVAARRVISIVREPLVRRVVVTGDADLSAHEALTAVGPARRWDLDGGRGC